MIVDQACYRNGAREPVDLRDGVLGELRAQGNDGGAFIWVGLHEPGPKEMGWIASMFGLHPLAVEDSLTQRQRPKVERYDDMLFVVLKTLWYVEERDEVETGQVAMFVGKDFVVTVRQGSGLELSSVRQDLERSPELHGHGASAVVYSVCDRIVDNYEAVARELEQDVDEIEMSVFSPERTQDSRRIYVLKREIAEFRRAVHPLRAPMERFAATSYPYLHEESGTFFRDIADHVIRVSETVDSLDTLLSTAFAAHNSRIQMQQNEDMRKISAWVALAAVGTLIAGVYGMNFRVMPELEWAWGYPFAMALMVLSAVVLWRLFKRSGWL